MTSIPVDLISLIGGLGLLLFSLGALTDRLKDSIARRFRPILERALSNAFKSLIVGVTSTTLVQASSITIIAIMGLVDSGLVTLEQGFFVTLGATLGTTLKAWFFVSHISFGPLLIGISSVTLLFVRHPLGRELLQITLAIGFAFLGLEMLSSSATQLREWPQFKEWIETIEGDDLSAYFATLALGTLMTVGLQSSSAMVIIVIGLVSEEVIALPTAALLVLGANIGTTSIGLLASLQSSHGGRRIAVAHFFAKLLGVLFTVLLLPTFLGGVHGVLEIFIANPNPAMLVAAVHTGFNLVNVFWWLLLASPLLRVVQFFISGSDDTRHGLSPTVRIMLASVPDRALAEVEVQLTKFEILARSVYDHVLTTLFQEDARGVSGKRVLLRRDLDAMRSTLHDLLFAICTAQSHLARSEQALHLVEAYTNVCRTGFGLDEHLERGYAVDGFTIPADIHPELREFIRDLELVWRSILVDERDPPSSLTPKLEVLVKLATYEDLTHEHRTWLLEVTSFLRCIGQDLETIAQLKTLSKDLSAEVTSSDEPV